MFFRSKRDGRKMTFDARMRWGAEGGPDYQMYIFARWKIVQTNVEAKVEVGGGHEYTCKVPADCC